MVLNKCSDRVSQNVAVESIFIRLRDTLAKAVLKYRTQYLYLFSETVVQFSDNKACKMAEVGKKKPICEAGKLYL